TLGAAAAQPVAPAAAASAPAPASAAAPAASPLSGPSGATEGSEGLGGAGGSGGSSGASSKGVATKLPPVKHVFVIVLSEQPYASVFGPSSGAPYLSRTLEQRGELLVRYDAVAHEQLANGVALISGQGPTVATAANCPSYGD